MALRRNLLIWGGATALGGAWAYQAFFASGEYRIGQARLVPPLLRARVGSGERLFGLVRRRETEQLPWLSLRDADSGERIELFALDAATLEPVFATPLLSVFAGEYGEAGILGEQNATIWIHLGGLGAASAVDGRVLADMEGIRARNPVLTAGLPESRAAYRFDNGLEFTDRMRANWRLDPRTFLAGSVREAPAAGLAPPVAPAPWFPAGIRGLAQSQPGRVWMGLLPAVAATGDPRLARIGGGPARLWRAVPAAAAAEAPAPAPAAPGKPPAAAPAVPAAPATEPVAVEDGPLLDAQILADGQGPLALPGAPGVLLLYRADLAAPFRLARVASDGTVAWRTALPLAVVNAVLPGDPVLILAGRRAGTSVESGPEAIAAIDLNTGALRARSIATGEAITA